MFLIILAVVCSSLSLISGIIAVGSGRQFHYTPADILKGRQNALLYVWVTFSTIFSMSHLLALTNHGIVNNWQITRPDVPLWMTIHTAIGLLLIAAHIFIKDTLSRNEGNKVYVWGSESNAT